jgi:hypothetical protein
VGETAAIPRARNAAESYGHQETSERSGRANGGCAAVGYKLHRSKENKAHEREKIALRWENEMLRFERGLSSGKVKDKQ